MKSVQEKIPLILLVMVFTMSCKSTVKTASITGSRKVGTEREAISDKQREAALRRTETEESIKQDAALTLKIMRENAPKVKLNEYFNAIAYADNTASANISITKGLALFASAETPVLVVMGEQNGKKQYQPTTIKAYFNYLKEEKKNVDDILNLKVDNHGRIVEVELRKNNEISGSANQ